MVSICIFLPLSLKYFKPFNLLSLIIKQFPTVRQVFLYLDIHSKTGNHPTYTNEENASKINVIQ
jgi:hypothetical protein